MNDKVLRSALLEELDFEPSIDSTEIGVIVENNVVTLTGHVPSYAQKMAAERAVWRVKGVRAVANDVEVRFVGHPMTDDEIAKRALSLLQWESGLPNDLRVGVQNGWITLEGEVQWQYQKDAAAHALSGMVGVIGVVNKIVLAPGPRMKDIKSRIEQALRRNAEVEAQQIKVELKDGETVTLEGKVDNWTEMQAVRHAAWSAPGVKHVIDHLSIGPR